ncbi:MAG: bifunctional ADP-dependent NAD(P)H-hydrate dehydratase/NAD(P)H-hydrate epimerase [Paracoccus sp.]|uniref:NAD(P)H-hydrate dehydratase n=1 Tax=Paracoccus sp. TaxID=267 RepID=UPI000C519FA2|nr:NAD(P)H-hydrate dehydratase [Paracoccus sp. (in: a-proteobacteria)]MBA48397.1 bifunctional ADP-dependent NAD(P)H-hydrate dehydratase/NAD(P)H-hydrate epimerase [Paracoccus sp. (in: a-proteobacteria)]
MLTGTEILTTAQMRAIESAAMSGGRVSGLTLMERAGAAVAGQIRLRWPRPGQVTVLCGPGNNGGDGYVIARHLARAGWRARVLGVDSRRGADAAEMQRRWRQIGPVEPLTRQSLRRAEGEDLCVDAIFGTGLTRPPEGAIADVLAGLGTDRFGNRMVAVDCPSGLCMDSGAMLGRPRKGSPDDPRAALTVAFDSPKPGHLIGLGPVLCGDLVIADIGLSGWRDQKPVPPSLAAIWPPIGPTRMRESGIARLAKRSDQAAHKFVHGHALVLAGPAGRGGAARLTARAALRVGAGLVTIGPPEAAMGDHAGPPDALMRRCVDSADDLERMLSDARIRAVAIGPGCGVDRAGVLLPALLASRRSCMIDADAITAIAGAPAMRATLHQGCVLTPHEGEFARLFPDLADRLGALPERGPAFSRIDAAREAAARCGAIVLLKGPDTVIAAPPSCDGANPHGRVIIHSAFDIPWLATAGAGDVLAGIIAGLLARGLPAPEAAGWGTLLHAKAARAFGPGLIGDDLPQTLPAVLREMGM